MKAYLVELKSCEDVGQQIIFAKNTKEARIEAQKTDVASEAESYIDVRVKRISEYDGMDKLSEIEFAFEQWKNGRYWLDTYDMPEPDEANKEDFIEWYKDNVL